MSSVKEKIAAAQAAIDAYTADHPSPKYCKRFFLEPVRDRNGDQSKVYIGVYTEDLERKFPDILGNFPVLVIDMHNPEGHVDVEDNTRYRGWESPEELDELEKIEAAIDIHKETFFSYRNLTSFHACPTDSGDNDFRPCVLMTVIDRTRIMGKDPEFPKQITAEDGTVYPVDIIQGIGVLF